MENRLGKVRKMKYIVENRLWERIVYILAKIIYKKYISGIK
jgi:hypothetical protein